jgi:uncharacterized membrane protein
MDSLAKTGRVFFAVPMIGFGIQYFIYGHYQGGLPPVPPWTPGGKAGAYLVGAFLIFAGGAIAANWKTRVWSFFLGAIFLLCVLFLHLQHFHSVIYDGTDRTRAFEPLSLAAIAFVLASMYPAEPPLDAASDGSIRALAILGRYLFAFCMVIFGIQHFLYAPFIAFLIPKWMPAHLFLAYFTGIAFIAAALAITFNILGRLACNLLGLMFFLWVVTLHSPRVVATLHNGDEWASLLVALATSGASFILGTTLGHSKTSESV